MTEFVERVKKVYEKAGAVMKKSQEDIKRQADIQECFKCQQNKI